MKEDTDTIQRVLAKATGVHIHRASGLIGTYRDCLSLAEQLKHKDPERSARLSANAERLAQRMRNFLVTGEFEK